MAEDMGFLKAGPRNVVDVHSTALNRRRAGAVSKKVRAYSEAPRASARGICGEAKRNSAEANPAFRPPQLGLLLGTLRSRVAIPPRASPPSAVALLRRTGARGNLLRRSSRFGYEGRVLAKASEEGRVMVLELMGY